MKLFIAEKPELAKAISEGISSMSGDEIKKMDGYFAVGAVRITYCFGHLLALCEPKDYDPRFEKWSMDHLPIITIPWRYKPIPGSKRQLDIVLRLIKEATDIVHAGDPDSEGQLLVDEVLTYAKNSKPVKRLLINDNNLELVKKALQNLKPNSDFAGLSNAALARAVADQLYGFNLSRAYTLAAQAKGLQENLSVGRVQTPILGLVVRRELEIERHIEKVRMVPRGVFAFGEWQISAPIDCDAEANFEPSKISQLIQECSKANANITSMETVRKLEQPPLPHNLLTLQSETHKKHGIKPDRTLQITQDLRDKHRLITYNRSDCQYLSDEHHPEASHVLAAIAEVLPSFAQKVQSCNPAHKSRAFNSANVSAHHAIIPTKATVAPGSLTDEEQKIYRLIAEGYVLQFLSPYAYDSTNISIECKGRLFKTTIRCVVDGGWRAVLQEHSIPDDKQHLPETFAAGSEGSCTSILTDVHRSKASPRYTLATLLEELCKVARHVSDPEIKRLLLQKDQDKKGEHGGIGTPATRASIVKGLFDRGYLAEKGKSIVPTDLGRAFYAALPEAATRPDLTALWHKQQMEIEAGNLPVNLFLKDLAAFLGAEVTRIRTEGLAIAPAGIKCPTCNEGILRRRKGPSGHFFGCSRYPDCRASYPDSKGKPQLQPPKAAKAHGCPSCDKPLRLREADGKKFWGCSGFPVCRETFLNERGKPSIRGKSHA